MRAGRDERGAAAVELALVLPVLALVAMATAPLVRLYADHAQVVALAQHGARYATRADRDPERGDVARYRPTADEVRASVADAAEIPVTVTVTPSPDDALPGDSVTVIVVADRPIGPLGVVVNAAAGLVGGEPPFPDGGVELRSTVVMREE